MPVEIAGQRMNVDNCLAWLKDGAVAQGLDSETRGCLDWFLNIQVRDFKYGSSMQSQFMNDLKAVMRPPMDQPVGVNSESVKLAGMDLLEVNLEAMRPKGDGRVTIKFCRDKQPPDMDMTKFFILFQNYIGVSEQGSTNLCTQGFEDCLGVLLTPTEKVKGGILAHLRRTIKRGVPELAYTVSHIMTVLELMPSSWGQVDMTLLMGGRPDDEDLLDLPGAIGRHPSSAKIRYIQDLRHFRRLMDQLLFNSQDKVFYIVHDTHHEVDEKFHEAEEAAAKEKGLKKVLTFKDSDYKMPYYLLQ